MARSMASMSSMPSMTFASRTPSRELLFGEIDCNVPQSLRSNTSICNLTLSSNSTFLRFWLNDDVRDAFLQGLPREELCKLRLVCQDFSGKAAAVLFQHIHVDFKSSTFSKPSRLAGLAGIGRHVRSLSFSLPHTNDTVLPPLIDPHTGEERSFSYTPQIPGSVSTPDSERHPSERHPSFGSWEVAELLVKQYPPIFHAATNVSAFIKAFECIPNLVHLQISCPGQEPIQHGWRSAVDFALISLRIAVERAPLLQLSALSFLPIHPSGLLYMQPLMGYGASPSSIRRWAQIRSMEVQMDSFDNDPVVRSGHLKTLHRYLQNFACSLTSFYFRWKGAKGPSPISLASEPCLCSDANPRSGKPSGLRAIRFTALSHMELENAVMDAAQISAFICDHKRTLTEFKFEQIKLRTGDWDEALLPLAKMAQKERARKRQTAESMDVPIYFSPPKMKDEIVHTIVEIPEPHHSEHHSTSLGRLLSRATHGKAARATQIAKAHLSESGGQVRRLLRSSLLGRR